MAALSPLALADLVTDFGFADRETALAVILGESGGDPNVADNINSDGSRDKGLWQFNDRWHAIANTPDVYDVQASTRAAYELSKGGTDFSPWAATRAPQFAAHKAAARAALAAYDAQRGAGNTGTGVGGGGGGGSSAGWGGTGSIWRGAVAKAWEATEGVRDVLTFPFRVWSDIIPMIGKALQVLTSPEFWRRAGLVLVGAVLLIGGAVFIFGPRVAKMTPQGQALDAVAGGTAAHEAGAG